MIETNNKLCSTNLFLLEEKEKLTNFLKGLPEDKELNNYIKSSIEKHILNLKRDISLLKSKKEIIYEEEYNLFISVLCIKFIIQQMVTYFNILKTSGFHKEQEEIYKLTEELMLLSDSVIVKPNNIIKEKYNGNLDYFVNSVSYEKKYTNNSFDEMFFHKHII